MESKSTVVQAGCTQLTIFLVGAITIIVSLSWNEAFKALLDFKHPNCAYSPESEKCNFETRWKWRRNIAIYTTCGAVVFVVGLFLVLNGFGVLNSDVGPAAAAIGTSNVVSPN